MCEATTLHHNTKASGGDAIYREGADRHLACPLPLYLPAACERDRPTARGDTSTSEGIVLVPAPSDWTDPDSPGSGLPQPLRPRAKGDRGRREPYGKCRVSRDVRASRARHHAWLLHRIDGVARPVPRRHRSDDDQNSRRGRRVSARRALRVHFELHVARPEK